MRGYLSPRFDWRWSGSPTQSYVIAATYRSGSSYLSALLWRTGRLGAPWEYFNYELEMELMQARLGVWEPNAYLAELIERRTSANGVFGFKAHFHHFAAALENSDELTGLVEGAKIIFIDRRDKLAQAVSMAKALQSGAWTSFGAPRKVPLFYSFELIEACLDELKSQAEGWWGWFGARGKSPFVVSYEQLLSDPTQTVAGVLNHLGPPREKVSDALISLPEAQRDATNSEWMRRFTDEWRMRRGARGSTPREPAGVVS